jgi:hypothetical protein
MRVRNWAAAVAGVGLIGFAVAQPPKVEPVKPVSGTAKAEAVKPADPLAAMLADARAALGKTRDYSGTYTRQERVGGKLGAEQVGEMKVRVNPVGVYVRFARPEASAGMEVAYSAAKKDGKIRYRPAGLDGRKGFQALATDDAKFLAEHRHPVTDWGVGPIVELIATAVAREKTLKNPVEVFTADYQFAGRNVTKFEIHTRRPHAFRYAARMVVFVDKETKLPVRFEAYEDPKSGATAAGELLEAYSFTDLKFNNGLGENSFDY